MHKKNPRTCKMKKTVTSSHPNQKKFTIAREELYTPSRRRSKIRVHHWKQDNPKKQKRFATRTRIQEILILHDIYNIHFISRATLFDNTNTPSWHMMPRIVTAHAANLISSLDGVPLPVSLSDAISGRKHPFMYVLPSCSFIFCIFSTSLKDA